MQYRKFGKHDIKVSVLGYGCMRFPLMEDQSGNVNEDEAIRLLRHAIDRGVNYIDTAYPYHNGKSEIIVGKALKDGYRDKVYLADKSPVWLVNTYEDFDKYLNEQLSKLDTDYIDFYLLHSLDKEKWEKIKNLGVLNFLDNALRDGRIRYAGFSFHDKIEVFKDIVDSYDWDFCQIQYNYMNEHHQAGTEGLHYAADKGLAVVVMEPLLGGKLAKTPPKEVGEIFDSAVPRRTPAEWGLRWLWDKEEITVVLSGMNSIYQVEENIRTADNAVPNSMSREEKALIEKVRDKYNELTKVNCTGCRYCVPCPAGVEIPEIFSIYNQAYVYNDLENSSKHYKKMKEENKASSCLECGKCEKACPQHLTIRQYLKDAHRVLSL